MACYRLYRIRGAHFSGFEEIEAANDAQAINAAERLSRAGHAELWLAGHKIKRLAPRQEMAGG